MSQVYQTRRKIEREAGASTRETQAKGPDLAQLMGGGAMPTAEQMGHRVDLPGAMRAKMEAAFGADLSGVELYESQTVADAGAQAVTMGNKIGFAPGKLDFASSGGQALLGHELSHVVSQARGEVTGSGFLSDPALEARADREGALAAAGESVYSGPVTPISTTSTALSAAGPMQAKKPKGRGKKHKESAEEKRARMADQRAERIIALSRGGIDGCLSDEEQSEYDKICYSKIDDDVMGALVRKQIESDMAVSARYYDDRVMKSQELSDEEMILRSGYSSDAFRRAAIGQFITANNLGMFVQQGEDETDKMFRFRDMKNEYLEGLDQESAAAAKHGESIYMKATNIYAKQRDKNDAESLILQKHKAKAMDREGIATRQALQETAATRKKKKR